MAVAILVVWRELHKEEEIKTVHLIGTTMGVVPYSIKYLDITERNLKPAIDSILVEFNQSLSTYISSSEISLLNQNNSIVAKTKYLIPILNYSKDIYEKSNGAFDPTIGPLVNAWGFGPVSKTNLDSATVDSLLQIVGFDKVIFDGKTVNKPAGTYLDFSATAKGYAVDVVADYLTSLELENFMIEIGGEIVCRGKNEKNNYWKIGIVRPVMSQSTGDAFAETFVVNTALATSGNYRNYYLDEGKIISHTISPFTGYPVQQSLLSASIFAPNCALADGFATACMVLGTDKSIQMIETNPELEGLLIFSDDEGNLQSYVSQGVIKQIEILD